MNKLALAGVIAIMLTGNAMASVLSAVESRDLGALQQALAAADANVDERGSSGQTPLLVAVWNNDLEAARLLIAAGADVNARDRINDSPYLVAGAEGRVEILRLILASGADLTSTNRYGGTALIPAAEKGHPEAVALLLEAGVAVDHVNNLGWTALLEAVLLTDGGPVAQAIVKQLLAAGADRTLADFDGKTPLEHARARGFSAIVTLLETP